MSLTRTYDASSETLSLTDVKNHLRITGTDEDDVLLQFIAAIRQKTETYLRRTLVTSTWVQTLDNFPELVRLEMGPVQSITSISYIDVDGNTQAYTTFQYDSTGRLLPAWGYTWPSTRDQLEAVTITYVCGATHAGNVQQDIKLAMLLWIGSMDINRENTAFSQVSVIPESAKSILNMYRDWQL
jgi:uncharacterized phiE125 gp8 family phage protein